MSGIVSIDIVANASKAVTDLKAVDREITNVQRRASGGGNSGGNSRMRDNSVIDRRLANQEGNSGGKLVNVFEKMERSLNQLSRVITDFQRSSNKTKKSGGSGGSGHDDRNPDDRPPENDIVKMFKGVQYGNIARSVAGEITKYVGMQARFENRSGIFSSALSGNITQAGNELINRQTEEKAFKGGNIAGAIGGAIGGIAGTLIAPGVGTVMGASLGASLTRSLTEAFIKAEGAKETGRRETRSSLSAGWLDLYPSLRKMSGLTGGESISEIFGAQGSAARAGNDFGLTAKETLPLIENYYKAIGGNIKHTTDSREEAMGSVAYGGVGKNLITNALGKEVKDALGISYATGVDKNDILQYGGTFRRYSGQSLKKSMDEAYSGNLAMGGNNVTLDEYMRGMTRIFQEGTAKGFARSGGAISQQIAGMSNFLSGDSSNSVYRNAENAAGFVSGVNNSIAASQNVGNASQAMIFRTASSLLGKDGTAMDSALAETFGESAVKNMSRVNKTKALAEMSGSNNEVFALVIDQLKKTSGGSSTYGVQFLQDAFGLSAVQAQLAWQGETSDLRKGHTGVGAPVGLADTESDIIRANQAAMSDSVTGAGARILTQAIQDMKDSFDKITKELNAVVNQGQLTEILQKNIEAFDKSYALEYARDQAMRDEWARQAREGDR